VGVCVCVCVYRWCWEGVRGVEGVGGWV